MRFSNFYFSRFFFSSSSFKFSSSSDFTSVSYDLQPRFRSDSAFHPQSRHYVFPNFKNCSKKFINDYFCSFNSKVYSHNFFSYVLPTSYFYKGKFFDYSWYSLAVFFIDNPNFKFFNPLVGQFRLFILLISFKFRHHYLRAQRFLSFF